MSHYVLFLSLNKNMAYSLFTCYLLLPVTVHDQDCSVVSHPRNPMEQFFLYQSLSISINLYQSNLNSQF
jgi:hypothetical protein